MKFTYKLTYEECYEAFYVLSLKWGKKGKKALTAVLSVIAAGLLICFWYDSRKIYCFFLAVLDIILLYILLYVPALKARKGAAAVRKRNGTYRIQLTEEGGILCQGETLKLRGDPDARAVETESVLVLRPDRQHTFCLPKRILSCQETEQIRAILKRYVKYIEM